jgi:hypothetical protein
MSEMGKTLMIVASCCGIAAFDQDRLPALGWSMIAVVLLLLAEAVVVAWRFRRESPPIWRRKLVLIPAVLAIPAVLVAFQVWDLYNQYVTKGEPDLPWIGYVAPTSPLDNAIAGTAWLCGMLIFTTLGLLAVGAYHILAAD